MTSDFTAEQDYLIARISPRSASILMNRDEMEIRKRKATLTGNPAHVTMVGFKARLPNASSGTCYVLIIIGSDAYLVDLQGRTRATLDLAKTH